MNIGYHEGYDCSILSSFNGKKIKNLVHFKEEVEKDEANVNTNGASDKKNRMEFKLTHHGYTDPLVLILDGAKAVAAQEEILSMNLISTRERFTDAAITN